MCVLSGCGGGTRAPVNEQSITQSGPRIISSSQSRSASNYIVNRGDTLYSIAFRYGIDFNTLAAYNNINSNDRIYPGQKLKLTSTDSSEISTARSGNNSILRDLSTVSPKPTIHSSQNRPARRANRTTVIPPKKKTEPVVLRETKPRKRSEVVAARITGGKINWHWPATGKVIATFKTRGKINKGINIAGNTGAPVKSAAKGVVVYAGNGLLGYGNLIIINHNKEFLSAYAHNRQILVKENERVEAEQKIAIMGRTGTERVMLHFEIRKNGKPVNPLEYLPIK